MEHPLEKYRREAGLTRRDLAIKAATTRQTIHRIEVGKQNPSAALIRRLMVATNGALTPNDFFESAA